MHLLEAAADEGVKDLVEHGGGFAGSLGLPYGGQGDFDVGEQDQGRHRAAEDQQCVDGQGRGDGGGSLGRKRLWT